MKNEKLERLRTMKLTPAQRVKLLYDLSEDGGGSFAPKELAEKTRLSVMHVRNLVRLRRLLSASAWRAFEAQGDRAVLKRWLPLAALPKKDQAASIPAPADRAA